MMLGHEKLMFLNLFLFLWVFVGKIQKGRFYFFGDSENFIFNHNEATKLNSSFIEYIKKNKPG